MALLTGPIHDGGVVESLQRLLADSAFTEISDSDRIVIFSDFHLGNGGARDDFLRNSQVCIQALRDYYLARGFRLILNGDVEELQRYSLKEIRRRWAEVYELFDEFEAGPGLIRLAGNHDAELLPQANVLEAVRLLYGDQTLFVFHGHQASVLYEAFNGLVGFLVRYVAHPLWIRNSSVSHDSAKQFRIERRVYEFSIRNRLVSIIGHTHRPLFETMSKLDSLKYRIEHLCRLYADEDLEGRERLAGTIRRLKGEVGPVLAERTAEVGSVYDSGLHVPCMFNSGCVIGRSGLTVIEIAAGRIALIHWFDARRSDKYLHYNGLRPERLSGTDTYRVTLKADGLRYVFTRIELLAG